MNGRELANEIRNSVCPDLKPPFISGYTVDIITQHVVPVEVVNIIRKPFSRLGKGDSW